MAKRTTNICVMIEYVPEYKARTTNIAVMVEYTDHDEIRLSNMILMLEYKLPYPPRILGPSIQQN